MSDLKLALTAAEATASVAYMPSSEMQLFTGSVSEICAGVEFYDLNGDKQTGTKSCSTPECTANGSVGCVTTTAYKSADFTNLLSDNIKAGVTVAGVAGNVTLPAATDVKSGSASYGTSGTEFTPSYSPDFPDVANVKTTDTVNGAAGTLDLSNLLASNIKRGIGVGGVTGNYPSVTSPLLRYSDDGATVGITGADETDLTSFAAQLMAAGNFEYWDSSGVRRTGSGDADIVAGNVKNTVIFENLSLTGTYAGTAPNAWDLRAGTTVGDVAGKLKVNCRNAVRLSGTSGVFDNTTSPAAAGSDIWDTIDDYHGLPASTDFPSSWSVANNYCGGVDDPNSSSDDDNVWKDVTTVGTGGASCADNPTGSPGSPENCTMQDKISGLKWSKRVTSGVSWQDAITACNASLHNGQTAGSWRLPTQKELLDAYNHGITSAARTDAYWMTLGNMQSLFWSSSSSSRWPTGAWVVVLVDGTAWETALGTGKFGNNAVVCVQ
jgi:hypothetical protein